MASVDRFANTLEYMVVNIVRKLGAKELASKPQPIWTAQTFSGSSGHELYGLRLVGDEDPVVGGDALNALRSTDAVSRESSPNGNVSEIQHLRTYGLVTVTRTRLQHSSNKKKPPRISILGSLHLV